SFTDVGGVTTFTVQIMKSLDGLVELAVNNDVLGGLVKLEGSMEITGDILVSLTFGLDDSGFFITPNDTNPEFVISNLQVGGDVKGKGQLGFLGLTVSDAKLTLDPAVKIAVKLRDPGTDAADGRIGLTELSS